MGLPGLLLLTSFFLGFSLGIDLHFDNVDSGFFFQQSSGTAQQLLPKFPAAVHSSNLNASSINGYPNSKLMLKEKLVVLRPSHPSKIEVLYGPFEAKQTLPALFVIPIVNFPQENLSLPFDNSEHTSLDVTAHIVNSDLRWENPVLRVLFHSGKHFHTLLDEEESVDKRKLDELWEDEQNVDIMQTCIALKVQNPNVGFSLTSTCAPQGLDGVCLASVTLPYDWWTVSSNSPSFPSLSTGASAPLHQSTSKPTKAVRNIIELSYTVYETKAGQCVQTGPDAGEKWTKFRGHGHRNHNANFPPADAVLIQSPTLIGSLRLSPNVYALRDLIPSEEASSIYPTLRFVTSASPLYPKSHFYVTVLLDSAPLTSSSFKEEPYAVVVRVKVKNGLRVVSTHSSNNGWNLNFDVNGKHISASATIVRNFSVPVPNRSQELFTWLLSVNGDSKDVSEVDGIRALWSWTIRSHMPYRSAHGSAQPHGKDGLDEVKGKFTSRFDVLKDEVQSVFPIIKRRELLNLATLTGRQVSEPLRVFMVTQGGKVADVTLQASCSSSDESVLKVSSSCTSVYLDGSEVRGSTNATFVARYGNVESTSSITVWVPELPLDIQLEDVKLNQIHGWKVPSDRSQCRLRYQQTLFEVYARFYAEDHNSGRVSYFLSRKTYLLITELVHKVMRVQDPRVASLKSNYVEGMKPGKTELQVLSPMSGHVVGSREIRIVSEKIEITSLSVQVISGLSLNIYPDPDLESCYVAEVDISEKLISKYQEAILDMVMHFSDGSSLSLRHTERSHYSMTAESLNTSVLVLTSPVKATILRVLALNEGRANVSVVLLLSDSCVDENQKQPLAASTAVVEVLMKNSQLTSVQNDARTVAESTWPDVTQSYTLPHTLTSNQVVGETATKRKMATDSSGGRGPSNGQGQLTFSKPGSTEFSDGHLSLKDDSNAVRVAGNSVRLLHSQAHPLHPHSSSHLTPLEIGMYALLAVFCGAIFVFVGTCFVYASRARKGAGTEHDPAAALPPVPPFRLERWWSQLHKKKDDQEDGNEGGEPQETSDKNWIWLGRSTLDRPSGTPAPVSTRAGRGSAHKSGKATDKETNRLSGISYSGSEVSVRITSHSRPQDGGRLTYTAELCFDDSANSVGDPPTAEIGRSPSLESQKKQQQQQQQRPGAAVRSPSIDSQTYTKKTPTGSMRLVANPNFMMGPAQQKKSGDLTCTNVKSKDSMESIKSLRAIDDVDDEAVTAIDGTEEPLLNNVVRRSKPSRQANRLSEQDTRRYARSWLMAGEAVPRDFNSNSSGRQQQQLAPSDSNSNLVALASDENDAEQTLGTFVRRGSPDIKQANIVENPRFSGPPSALADAVDEASSFESGTAAATKAVDNSIAVDYERIISYLGILKETST